MIDAEELPPIRAEGRGARDAGHAEPGVKPARHGLILARQDDPSERRVRHGQQIEILRHVRLVVAYRSFIGKTEILGVKCVDPQRRRRVVTHAEAPRPGCTRGVERERGRGVESPGKVGRPGDGARSDAPERAARAHDSRGTGARLRQRSFTVRPTPDMPPHQQPEQALLGRARQKLIDENLTVTQGEQRAARKKLGPEPARRLEPDQAEPRVVSDRDAGGMVGWRRTHDITRVQRTFLAVR